MADETVTDSSKPDESSPTGTARFNELGRSGLKHYSGLVYEEFLPQLQGLKAYKVYTEMMENSAVVGAVLFAVESMLRSVDWTVEPASDDPKDIEAAQFVEEAMHDMSHTWEDFISEVLTMLPFGWSYFEVVFKKRKGRKGDPHSRYDDDKIGWRKFAPRAQETLYRWEIDPNGGIRGMHQYPHPTGGGAHYSYSQTELERSNQLVFLPIERCLLFRTTSRRNNPEGRSMLRTAYRSWYFSKRVEEIEAIGLERDLAGMPYAGVPIELLQQDRTAEATATFNFIKDIVTKTKRDEQEGIIFPLVYDENGNELYKFELLSSGGKRTFDTGSIIQRYTQQIASSVLADFILLGHESTGSFALSSDKTELFAVALGSILDSIEDMLNRHALPRLLELNDFPVDDHQPMLRHGDIEKPDLQELIQYIQGLATAGAPLFPDLVLENHLRELGDLPPITEEEREAIEEAAAEKQQAMMEQQGAPPGMGMGPEGGKSGMQQQKSPFGQNAPGRPKENFGDAASKNEASSGGGEQGRPANTSSQRQMASSGAGSSAVKKSIADTLAKVGK